MQRVNVKTTLYIDGHLNNSDGDPIVEQLTGELHQLDAKHVVIVLPKYRASGEGIWICRTMATYKETSAIGIITFADFHINGQYYTTLEDPCVSLDEALTYLD